MPLSFVADIVGSVLSTAATDIASAPIFQKTRVNMIFARSANGIIGKDGVLPWHLPEDLLHFKQLTLGMPVIMGRKTWDSLPEKYRPLPGRLNIVITHQFNWEEKGAYVVGTMAEAISMCKWSTDAWVIGGAQIYELAKPFAHRIEVTEIEKNFEGDAFAPQLGAEWHETQRESHTSTTGLAYSFVTYQRTPQLG